MRSERIERRRVGITLTSKFYLHTMSCDLSSERCTKSMMVVDGPTVAQASISSRGRRQVHYKAGVSQILDKYLPEFEAVKSKLGWDYFVFFVHVNFKSRLDEARAGVSVEQQVMAWKGRRGERKKLSSSTVKTSASSYSAPPQMPNLTFGFMVRHWTKEFGWETYHRKIIARRILKGAKAHGKEGRDDTSMNSEPWMTPYYRMKMTMKKKMMTIIITIERCVD